MKPLFYIFLFLSLAHSQRNDIYSRPFQSGPEFDIDVQHYDIDLMLKISSKVNIPVIASGGVGNLDHLVDGIKLGNASAVLAESIFHYGKYSVKQAKEYLNSKGVPVRI